MTEERLRRQLEFALEIDKEKNIFRQTHLSGHGRNENDAEHAWHMAVMAFLLQEYANEEVDISRVMRMCLLHDIVEIDAGDTYAYDEAGLATQKEREDAAKERIFSILPDDQKAEFTALFDEFEACGTAESRFAHAMDNLQPLLLNDANGGGDWREHKVTAKQVYGRQSRTRMGSERLYQVTDSILRRNIAAGNLIPSEGFPAGPLPAPVRGSGSPEGEIPDSPEWGNFGSAEQENSYSAEQENSYSPEQENACGQEQGNFSSSERENAVGREQGNFSSSERENAIGREQDQTESEKRTDPAGTAAAFSELAGTVSSLMSPDGCPWDRAQTHETLKAPCIEEAAEVISGINILSKTGRPECLCEELGDLLLQVMMHAMIAEKEGLFTLEDVIRGINAKMIRRHPHIFGEKSRAYLPAGAKEELCGKDLPTDWKQIKAFEKRGREWEEAYLFQAFDEAQNLIEVARKRKTEKNAR